MLRRIIMRDLHRSPAFVAALCWACLTTAVPLPVMALEDGTITTPSATPADSVTAASLERARVLIKDGEYDGAIEILKASIQRARPTPVILRDAYLLLIKTYVFVGNDLKFKPQGREASNLNYQEAKKLIAECLRIDVLRHTHPEPASEYPPEMISAFAEVRSKIFGSFRVADLKPPGAVVLLDADTLQALPGDSLLGDVDLEVGPHRVNVIAKGYRPVTQEILISPNSTLERSYRLSRKRGAGWYAAASGVALAGVIGIFAIGRGSADEPPPGEEPLPPAPPPPTR